MAAGAAQSAPLQNRAQSCSGARRETSARLYAISIGQLCAFYCAIQPAFSLCCSGHGVSKLIVLLLERDAMSRLRGTRREIKTCARQETLAHSTILALSDEDFCDAYDALSGQLRQR